MSLHTRARCWTPPDISTEFTGILLSTAAKELVSLIAEKEQTTVEFEKKFEALRERINELYYLLDEKIATVLAVIQMDKVLGKSSASKPHAEVGSTFQ